ncbi:hypothetical protein AVEN_102300-1 [Araneus ventricosus]|uniref:Reverse transcriptase domain-containing protein n=1 Tax=Araneus ventricosus TaxID=182803 RepID=A0A4Y2IFK0_ARAVE|nr:hypothetical protein AVEN_102300-1 [Araneus ventricosus]
MAITKLLDSIHKGKVSGDHIPLLSIDIKGAFDNIQHNTIESYLDDTVAWCLEPTVHIVRKLSTIQRPFLLAISGAYKTTSTAALRVILGIPPLHLQLQREARDTALYRPRLPLSTNVINNDPSEIEEKSTGLSAESSEHLSRTQISLVDGSDINTGLRIYKDGSERKKGVGGSAF